MEVISIVDIAIMVANLYYNSFWFSDCKFILVSFLSGLVDPISVVEIESVIKESHHF